MKQLRDFINEGKQEDTIRKLNKANGGVYSDIWFEKDGEKIRIGRNGDFYFLIMPDGTYERTKAKDLESFLKSAKKTTVGWKYAEVEKVDPNRVINSSRWDDVQDEMKEYYKVKMTPVKKEVDIPKGTEHDYDLSTLFPKTISRIDGEDFDITDVQNMKTIANSFTKSPFNQNFQLTIRAKKADKEAVSMIMLV